jgi:hypothetical protein
LVALLDQVVDLDLNLWHRIGLAHGGLAHGLAMPTRGQSKPAASVPTCRIPRCGSNIWVHAPFLGHGEDASLLTLLEAVQLVVEPLAYAVGVQKLRTADVSGRPVLWRGVALKTVGRERRDELAELPAL